MQLYMVKYTVCSTCIYVFVFLYLVHTCLCVHTHTDTHIYTVELFFQSANLYLNEVLVKNVYVV